MNPAALLVGTTWHAKNFPEDPYPFVYLVIEGPLTPDDENDDCVRVLLLDDGGEPSPLRVSVGDDL